MTKIMAREGQLVVPTCPHCGCRLEKKTGVYYKHFGSDCDYDARGCKCPLISKGFAVIDSKVTEWPFMMTF